MSCFGGIMNEYKFLSIDRFDSVNLKSSVFMLSHNHSDHTIGLASAEFKSRLLTNPAVKLYCSEVSRNLLLINSIYDEIKESIIALPVNSPTILKIPNDNDDKNYMDQTITVTCLQAGHCPGSVMFLIQGSEGDVLYTGDFRLTLDNLTKMPNLSQYHLNPKTLKSVYMDTTFFNPKTFFIPSREDSLKLTCDLISDWLKMGRDRLVTLKFKASLGYEFLLLGLYKHFNEKVVPVFFLV
ncbi:hypothetical protein HELRODRAFT_92422 [Helobdella robusta]|uniref:Metallo-beta-lactamase domain-containing protein n=1 Tax=Helobdella robusta TaxID=6412 RepID=T1G8G0_HELRO|nr:hypothetical protein HELRODRAFT_92422 [Helobdella robusta]ESO06743.1 hypothetical protein HELRODRAFT_92422 [Helobdella robusta]